jgi:pimeloyl-ACP methyl ester carboxylesterase
LCRRQLEGLQLMRMSLGTTRPSGTLQPRTTRGLSMRLRGRVTTLALTLALTSTQGVAQVATSADNVPVDRSPHVERFIDVNGARLQLLDWGGDGPVLLFMPGFGNGAHIFDDLAPAFSDHFHSLALTPRGFPPSSAPDSGYTITQLAQDVRGVLDSLHVSKAVLAGHSISGAVLTRFASLYPDRLLAAIYLDAAYDFGDAYRRSQEAKRETPQPPADTMAAAFQSWRRRFPDWDAVREIDAGMWNIDSSEIARRQILVNALVTEVRSHPNEIWRVQAPALSLCALGSMERSLGWLTPDSARWEAARRYVSAALGRKHTGCQNFRRRVPHGRVVELDSGHHVFLDQAAAVVRAMRKFLEEAMENR